VSPGGRDRRPSQLIIDDLPSWTGQHVDRVSTSLPVDDHTKDQFVADDFVFDFVRLEELRIDNRAATSACED
jgi:hypothetical protein